MTARRKITADQVEEGINIVARLIDRYGDVYWPIFERLEYELAQRRSRAARLQARLNHGRRLKRSPPPQAIGLESQVGNVKNAC
ncbi:MAG: hypothetical protein ACE5FO_13575 [Parvularculaceae bacterium]